jgi:hypothetical protein
MPQIYSTARIFPLAALAALAALATLGTLAACGKDSSEGAKPRQIELAPVTQGQPELNDAAPPPAAAPTPVSKAPEPRAAQKAPLQAPVASTPAPQGTAPVVAPAPVTPTPAPATAPAAAAVPAPIATGTIDAGASFAVKPAVRVCTSTHKAGDRFTATLGEAVKGSNGAVIPAGSVVVLRVVESQRTDNSKPDAALAFDVLSVRIGNESYEVDGKVTPTAPMEKVGTESASDQAKTTAKGAAIGAIAGQVLGRNTKSTVIGAVIGGVAGAMTASGSNQYDGCLRSDGTLTIALDKALKIKLPAKP